MIALVMLAYFFIISRNEHPRGIAWLSAMTMHYVTPPLYAPWWAAVCAARTAEAERCRGDAHPLRDLHDLCADPRPPDGRVSVRDAGPDTDRIELRHVACHRPAGRVGRTVRRRRGPGPMAGAQIVGDSDVKGLPRQRNLGHGLQVEPSAQGADPWLFSRLSV